MGWAHPLFLLSASNLTLLIDLVRMDETWFEVQVMTPKFDGKSNALVQIA